MLQKREKQKPSFQCCISNTATHSLFTWYRVYFIIKIDIQIILFHDKNNYLSTMCLLYEIYQFYFVKLSESLQWKVCLVFVILSETPGVFNVQERVCRVCIWYLSWPNKPYIYVWYATLFVVLPIWHAVVHKTEQ